MAYDEELAVRLRHLLEGEPGLTERRMFGGLAFLIDDKLAVAAGSLGDMLLRVDPIDTPELVSHRHVDRYVMRERAMDGWLRVGPEAVATADDLSRWVAYGVDYARSLPAK